MKISVREMQELKDSGSAKYEQLKLEFLYHSNKLSGSTFSKAELKRYIDEEIIEGTHEVNNLYEMAASIVLFDFMIETLEEPITEDLLREFYRVLKRKSYPVKRRTAGEYGKNLEAGEVLDKKTFYNIPERIRQVIDIWEASEKTEMDIVDFHAEFEKIHPGNDGNGRIGRIVALKQSIESNLDLVCPDVSVDAEYHKGLQIFQETGCKTKLLEVLQKCQQLVDEKILGLENE